MQGISGEKICRLHLEKFIRIFFAEASDFPLKFRFALNRHLLARRRMGESDFRRVEHEPLALIALSVERVADNRAGESVAVRACKP